MWQGHALTLKETQCSNGEGDILLQRLFHGGLPEPQQQVKGGVILTPTEGIYGIMDSRQWKGILPGLGIQFLEIDTKPESSIFLMD